MEPDTTARDIEEVVPGIWRWHLLDDRIGSESDAYAVADADGAVLIDPLPLEEHEMEKLGKVSAICLTAACHQRSAWRYRRAFGAKVYAPEDCAQMDEEPDVRFADGDRLPGGLTAIYTPGPEAHHFAFLRKRRPSTLFCADLLGNEGDKGLDFIPLAYHDDPEATIDSTRHLLDFDFSVLCLDHGTPITKRPKAAIRKLLKLETGA